MKKGARYNRYRLIVAVEKLGNLCVSFVLLQRFPLKYILAYLRNKQKKT